MCIPSHSGIIRNDKAHKLAEKARNSDNLMNIKLEPTEFGAPWRGQIWRE